MKKLTLKLIATVAITGVLYMTLSDSYMWSQVDESINAYEAMGEEHVAFVEFVAKFGKTYASRDSHQSRF
jgi:hypothetical protein